MSEETPEAEQVVDCCTPVLGGQWHPGRVVICPECLRFHTAAIVDGIPSWWTGSLPMRESAR